MTVALVAPLAPVPWFDQLPRRLAILSRDGRVLAATRSWLQALRWYDLGFDEAVVGRHVRHLFSGRVRDPEVVVDSLLACGAGGASGMVDTADTRLSTDRGRRATPFHTAIRDARGAVVAVLQELVDSTPISLLRESGATGSEIEEILMERSQRAEERCRQLELELLARTSERDSALEELEATQGRLRASRHLEALGSLSASVAHDFNNMLSVILSFTDLVLQDTPASHPHHEDLKQISLAATKATRLTSQLLTFSRQPSWHPRSLDLDRVLTDLERMLRRLCGDLVTLEFDLGSGPNPVFADPARLEQVVTNLVVNARDSMHDGGRLVVRTRPEVFARPLHHPDFGELPAGRYLRVSFSDTGVGMTPDVRARIFEPYFTTKDPGRGTGLGLATVFGIVKRAAGAIEVTSEPGLGSTFDLVLPLGNDPGDFPLLRTVTGDRGGTETVLLAADDAGLRAEVASTLRARGYVVLEARSPSEALTVSETYLGPIDLLLTDDLVRTSGQDLSVVLLRARPHLQALCLSNQTHLTGAAFLRHPFTAEELAIRVRELLDEH